MPPLKTSGKGTHRKKCCVLDLFFFFFLFPSFFGRDKIEALLGATQQMMFSGPTNSGVAA